MPIAVVPAFTQRSVCLRAIPVNEGPKLRGERAGCLRISCLASYGPGLIGYQTRACVVRQTQFQEVSAFTYTFRRWTGMSPTEMRAATTAPSAEVAS